MDKMTVFDYCRFIDTQYGRRNSGPPQFTMSINTRSLRPPFSVSSQAGRTDQLFWRGTSAGIVLLSTGFDSYQHNIIAYIQLVSSVDSTGCAVHVLFPSVTVPRPLETGSYSRYRVRETTDLSTDLLCLLLFTEKTSS